MSTRRNKGGRPREIHHPLHLHMAWPMVLIRRVDELVRRYPHVLPSRNKALRALVALGVDNVDTKALDKQERELRIERGTLRQASG